MHKHMSPHGDYDYMGEAINLVNNFKRNSIKRLSGTMPEDLPTPNRSLKESEKDNK